MGKSGKPHPHHIPNSLTQRCLRYVLANGQVTVAQVVAAVQKDIPAAQALSAGKRQLRADCNRPNRSGKAAKRNPNNPLYTVEFLTQWGRRILVYRRLGDLVRNGSLRRVRPGVYAPPLPRLHNPEEQPPGQVG